MRENKLFRCFKYIILVFATIYILFPIVWTLFTSIKPELQIFAIPTVWLPNPVTFSHYIEILHLGEFQIRLWNSIAVAVSSTAISMAVGIPAAYAYAKYPFKWGGILFGSIAAVRMIPMVVLGIPIFLTMRNLQLLDTRLGLIIIYLPLQLTLSIWMMYGNFKQIPRDLEYAAQIDGLGALGTLARIVVPISIPMICTAAVFSFLASWNEFFFAMLTTSSARSMTLPIYIASNVTTHRVNWGRMTSMAMMFAIPAILFTLFAQKGLVKGLTAGALKG